MTKAGLMNSLGWMPKIQRFEPFTSWPNSRATTIRAMPSTKVSKAARRTSRGDKNEVASSTAMAGIKNIT